MVNSALFRGFKEEDIEKMMKCAGGKLKVCNTNETIMSFERNIESIYILLSGAAEMVSYDYDGNQTILERYTKDSIFGEMFSPYSNFDEVFVTAKTPCKVIIIKYSQAITQCENACSYHRKFLDNLFSLLANKMSTQSHHIEVLSKRSIREKLIAYFEIQANEQGSFSFTLPFSLSSLADYISVDRSAMQREIKRLNDEGKIENKGRKITLKK